MRVALKERKIFVLLELNVSAATRQPTSRPRLNNQWHLSLRIHFISHTAATAGVEIENTGVDDLVGLRYFGPDTWDSLPAVGDYKK